MPQGNQGSNPCPSAIARLVTLIPVFLLVASSALAQEKLVTDPATLDLAKQQFEAGKFQEASATLDGLEEKEGVSGRSLDLRGRLAMEQGRNDEASRLFTEAREKDPKSLGQLHLADLLLREKKYAEARETYRAAAKLTDMLGVYERLRFGLLLSYLGEKNDAGAQESLGLIRFPSESGAYYYAQAAWAYAHGSTRDAETWIKRCNDISGGKASPWFANRFFDLGWIKTKPALVAD